MHDATEARGKPRLLIVEDDDALRGQMRWALAGEYDVLVAGDRASALAAMGQVECAVVTLDLGLPPCSRGVEEGFATLAAIAEQHPAAKVVVITGREEREHALAAVGRGAYDYFCKPVDIGGYYRPDPERAAAAMRPSATFNRILESIEVTAA